jgi:hypothetical protein
MKAILQFVASVLLSPFLAPPAFAAADRPNILWITSEDNSPYLGCYGDGLANTPRLDRLAWRKRNDWSLVPNPANLATAFQTILLPNPDGLPDGQTDGGR